MLCVAPLRRCISHDRQRKWIALTRGSCASSGEGAGLADFRAPPLLVTGAEHLARLTLDSRLWSGQRGHAGSIASNQPGMTLLLPPPIATNPMAFTPGPGSTGWAGACRSWWQRSASSRRRGFGFRSRPNTARQQKHCSEPAAGKLLCLGKKTARASRTNPVSRQIGVGLNRETTRAALQGSDCLKKERPAYRLAFCYQTGNDPCNCLTVQTGTDGMACQRSFRFLAWNSQKVIVHRLIQKISDLLRSRRGQCE